LVSEIMLKKTTARAVENLLPAFLSLCPNVVALNAALRVSLRRVLRPIGLSNQRAVQLKHLARALNETHNGIVPKSIVELEHLPGVGPYTARAVAAATFDSRALGVDANVARLIVRFFGLVPDRFEARRSVNVLALAETLSRRSQAGKGLLWAMLDHCAQVCTARKPKCGICALQARCAYRLAHGTTLTHPEQQEACTWDRRERHRLPIDGDICPVARPLPNTEYGIRPNRQTVR
jgi:A/G-specific adenine glycosylase